MQYKVPQNIDQEDKILGPLTFTQFVYALIGGGLLLFEYSIFDTAGFLLFGIPTLILTICFSLIKVQDQPFTRFFVSLLVFLKQPKQRIWKDLDEEKPVPPLGADFMADLHRDEPSPVNNSANKTVNKTVKNTVNDTVSNTPTPPIDPAKPARRLQVKTNEQGSI